MAQCIGDFCGQQEDAVSPGAALDAQLVALMGGSSICRKLGDICLQSLKAAFDGQFSAGQQIAIPLAKKREIYRSSLNAVLVATAGITGLNTPAQRIAAAVAVCNARHNTTDPGDPL